jgi:hypothetical protein
MATFTILIDGEYVEFYAWDYAAPSQLEHLARIALKKKRENRLRRAAGLPVTFDFSDSNTDRDDSKSGTRGTR